MKFYINPNPIGHAMFDIKPVGGKYKTKEITPFCKMQNIPMYDLRDTDYNPEEDTPPNGYSYTYLNKHYVVDSKHGIGNKIELNEKERRILYKGFEIQKNTKGYYMIYDAENVIEYLKWKAQQSSKK